MRRLVSGASIVPVRPQVRMISAAAEGGVSSREWRADVSIEHGSPRASPSLRTRGVPFIPPLGHLSRTSTLPKSPYALCFSRVQGPSGRYRHRQAHKLTVWRASERKICCFRRAAIARCSELVISMLACALGAVSLPIVSWSLAQSFPDGHSPPSTRDRQRGLR